MPGGVELATAYVTLKADGRRLPGEAAAYGAQSGKAFGRGFSKSSLTSEKALERIGRTSKRVFLGGALGIAYAEKKAADFNAQMATVYTLSHANTKQQELLARAAKTVGVNIGYSATQSADAEEELIKAGVKLKDIMGGGLKGTLDLAAAGQTDVASATEVAASAMTQFSLKGKDVPHIADLLAAGADKALGSVTDLGYGLSQAGTTAHQMNLSIEDTVGTLAEFAQNGLIGERAGTTLKMMLLRLANPTQKSSDLMDKYGLSIYKANGQLKSMPEIAGQLRKSFKDLDPAQRNAALGTIFGSRAIQAANILIKDGEKGNRRWIDSVNDQGFAAHQAGGKMDSLRGDAAKLKAELDNAFINASGKQSFLRMLAQDATKALKWYNKLSDAQRETINNSAVKVVAGAGIVYAATKVLKLARSASDVYGAMFKTKPFAAAIDAAAGGRGLGKGVVPVYVTNWGKGPGGLPGAVDPKTGKPRPSLADAERTTTRERLARTFRGNRGPGLAGWSPYLLPLLTSGDTAQRKPTSAQTNQLAAMHFLQKSSGAPNPNRGGFTHGDKTDNVLSAMLGSDPPRALALLREGAAISGQTREQLLKLYPVTAKHLRAADAENATQKSLFELQQKTAGARLRQLPPIQKYDALIRKIPPEVATKVTAPGFKPTSANIDRLQKKYNLAKRPLNALIKLVGGPQAIAEANRVEARLNRLNGKTIKTFIRNITTHQNVGSSAPGKGLDGLLDGGRANGGRVSAGRLYRVNERGVELFQPGVNGYVQPHRAVREAITASRRAHGGAERYAPAARSDGSGRGAGRERFELTITNWEDGSGYIETVADERYYVNRELNG